MRLRMRGLEMYLSFFEILISVVFQMVRSFDDSVVAIHCSYITKIVRVRVCVVLTSCESTQVSVFSHRIWIHRWIGPRRSKSQAVLSRM